MKEQEFSGGFLNHEILNTFKESKLVAVVRRLPPESVNQVLKALVDGGLKVLEITMDAKEALEVITSATNTFGKDVLVGAGTVKTKEQVSAVIQAGARFLVSPHLDSDLVFEAHRLGCPFIPGVLTPTEIQAALKVGAEIVKVFPARALGSGYIKDLLGPFKGLNIMVTGGIDETTAASYIQEGALAVGMGSSLFPKQDIDRGDFAAISLRVRRILASISH